jgi:hypothetical protein
VQQLHCQRCPNNHELLAKKDIGVIPRRYLHIIDTIALAHAPILRLHALILQIKI